MCARKEITPGLKLVRKETDVATHTCKLLFRKKAEHWDINISFENFCEIKACPKTWAYFTWKLDWLKTSAGTNMGSQNNTYLSAPVYETEEELMPCWDPL